MKDSRQKGKNIEPSGTQFPDRNSIRAEYLRLLPERTKIVRELITLIEEVVSPVLSYPRVQGRVKSFGSYFKKYLKFLKDENYVNNNIADVIGIRIICPFLEDLAAVEELLKEKFKIVEVERKGGDHTFREFGYESIHLLIEIPLEFVKKVKTDCCETAEIQIRTMLQDAWAEVEHEFVYKAEFTPFDNPLKRKLAAVNASLVLADIIFQETRSYLRLLNGELDKRRYSFFRKIEDSTDAVLFQKQNVLKMPESIENFGSETDLPAPAEGGEFDAELRADNTHKVSIDELLVEALTAHNKNQFKDAIAVYTQILDMKADDTIRSLIYKHRGMAHFARSNYDDAIADFSESLRLDPKSYKAAYYEGIVCSVLQNYSNAVDAFNRSLAINPFQPYCLFRRGQAYYHLGDFPKALGDCEAALALESFDAARKFKDLVLNKLKM
jgi:putative GTP pyrophosphokinase